MSFSGENTMNLLGFFNKLSREKRKELIVVVLATVVVLSGLGFGLIKYQFSVLAGLEDKQAKVDRRLDEMQKMVKRADLTEDELAVASEQLAKLEETMASRDVFSWMVNTLRTFKQSYKVDIPQVGQPVPGDVTMLPRFPYKQATLKVSGTARYHELGRFLADFENQFPHVRLLNLSITPASVAGERGSLSFNIDIVTLVNPNQ